MPFSKSYDIIGSYLNMLKYPFVVTEVQIFVIENSIAAITNVDTIAHSVCLFCFFTILFGILFSILSMQHAFLR